MSARTSTPVSLAMLLALVATLALAADAGARTQLGLVSQFGGAVNQTQVAAKGGPALEDLCTVASGNTCQVGVRGSASAFFAFSRGVAVDQASGDVYVADQSNNRVQEFNSAGEYVRMFGGEVDEATKGNVCPEKAGDTCKAGVSGGGAGQLRLPMGVAVEQSTGDVYVVDFNNHRVLKFGPDGEFMLMFGGEVDEATKGNVCPEKAGDTCKTAAVGTADGEFEAWPVGSFIAVGSGVVYVGDRARIQEFEPSGAWKANIPLTALSATGRVTALEVDASGDVYLKDEGVTGVRELNPAGTAQIGEFDSGSSGVSAIALNSAGDPTVIDGQPSLHGVVYKPTGEKIGEFGVGTVAGATGIAYDNAGGQLYVSGVGRQDVEIFGSFVFATAITGSPSAEQATGATLHGKVDPEGTDASLDASSLFEYGKCSTPTTCSTSPYGEIALSVPFEDGFTGEVPVEASLTGLVPNQEYHYILVAHNKNGSSPGGEEAFKTLAIPPRIESQPPSFVTVGGAILNGIVNPEHLFTEYRFEYGPCATPATCPASGYSSDTPILQSATYGALGASQELSGLKPSTAYHYRFLAANAQGPVAGAEETFTTTAVPAPGVATGAASGVTQNAATISGTVDPNGVATVYRFQLSAGAGATVVASGEAGSGSAAETITAGLSGLQPGTTYAYRLVASNAYGVAEGADATFTTPGFPNALAPPAAPPLIAVPAIAFPTVRGVAVPVAKKKPSCQAQARKIGNARKRRRALQRCAAAKRKSKKKGKG